ncbi:efflux RND transporter periplasmic adaptor subunit [Cognatishimia activa]|uniref:HlyD family efflux transporter periplasmic adaptor subunit n=1 Tax=Cognatishimia activa TaxID=1715691 RepID=A0A975EQV7_9RHOB|nr:HlyD family efflux transporter periplasmic adaptor subunit [Cognatishimia activa]QTN36677.1 HlyD family efflux transporter periplasmic adaptor subunit [Cognatishimia activa]
MRFLRQSLAGLFLLSATVALLMMAGNLIRGAVEERMSQEPRTPPQRERVFTVNVVPATPADIAPVLTVFGEIQSRRTLELRTAAGGAIVELFEDFEEGGQVTAGDLLLRIDDADARDALARAQTEWREAEAEVRDADRGLLLAQDDVSAAMEQAELRAKALARQQDLEARGVGTAAAIEAAELNLASARQSTLSRRQALANAEARVDQAATSLERAGIAVAEAERNLDDRMIRADFTGTLAEVSVVTGGLVTANERIAQLIDPNALEVAFRVSTAQYARLLDENGRLKASDVTVALNVSGIDLTATGKISRDSAAVGEGQTGRLVFATLDAPRGLKPDDFVQVSVQEPVLNNVIAIPSSALTPQGDVLVLGEGDRLEALPVRMLRRQEDQIIVRGRELAGREVVARLSPVLGVGIKVKPIREGAKIEAPQAPEMVALTDERRAKLVAFVEANNRMPAEAKQRVLGQLQGNEVPARLVNRLEQRMGG